MKNKTPSKGVAVSKDLLRDAWESLGIAFVGNESGNQHADPERTILDSLKDFQEDRKMLKLVLAWLQNYGALVHVERIKSLAENLPAVELAWLGGLASHRIEAGDLRWRSVKQMIEKHLGKSSPHFPTSELDKLQAQRNGEDSHFKKFGLIIPKAESADTKKLRPVSVGIKMNLWLRMRALFGTNWRADMATILLLGLASNPYQAELKLGCAKETAYRNWKALKDAEVEKLLKDAAA